MNQDNPKYGWAAAYKDRGEYGEDFYSMHRMRGVAPLIAAMRCYVASKRGEYVNVPTRFLGPYGDHGQEFFARVSAIPALAAKAGPAFTFGQLAKAAIAAAGGNPASVDWQAVEDSAMKASIVTNRQEPGVVAAALHAHSPGAITESEQKSVSSKIRKITPDQVAAQDASLER